MKKINLDLLRQVRISKEFTQETLAELAGLSTRTIQRIEAGALVTPETAKAIAASLGVQNYRVLQSADVSHTMREVAFAAPSVATSRHQTLNDAEVAGVRQFFFVQELAAGLFFLFMVALAMIELFTNQEVQRIVLSALSVIAVILAIYVIVDRKNLFNKARRDFGSLATRMTKVVVFLVVIGTLGHLVLWIPIAEMQENRAKRAVESEFILKLSGLSSVMHEHMVASDINPSDEQLAVLMKNPDVRRQVELLNEDRASKDALKKCVSTPFEPSMTVMEAFDLTSALIDSCIQYNN
jgi:DNA-binding XRE family transcriptional regulator